MNSTQSDLELAMRVHNQLIEAIAPATPGTIKYSNLSQNRVLQFIGAAGIVGFLLLLISSFLVIDNSSADSVLTRLSGAMLGTSFYAFWTARTYLREGVFNRQYSQDYIVRFGIGVIAGFILGSIIGDSPALGEAGKQFGPFTLAVVGGYSAEAVVQILQRIKEILVASIKGGGQEQARADADHMTKKRLSETAVKMQEALQEKDSELVAERIQEIARGLLK